MRRARDAEQLAKSVEQREADREEAEAKLVSGVVGRQRRPGGGEDNAMRYREAQSLLAQRERELAKVHRELEAEKQGRARDAADLRRDADAEKRRLEEALDAQRRAASGTRTSRFRQRRSATGRNSPRSRRTATPTHAMLTSGSATRTRDRGAARRLRARARSQAGCCGPRTSAARSAITAPSSRTDAGWRNGGRPRRRRSALEVDRGAGPGDQAIRAPGRGRGGEGREPLSAFNGGGVPPPCPEVTPALA